MINYGGSMFRKPVVFAFNPLGVSSSRSMNYTFNMSFFVWKGWLNQKETQERLENISSAATSTTSARAFRFPVIGLNLLSQSQIERANKDYWLADSNTYLAINYIDESYDVYSDDIQSNVKEYNQLSKCWKVSNVQFEQAPNDYVRIKIGFYMDGMDRILFNSLYNYFKFPVVQFALGDQMNNAEWFSKYFKMEIFRLALIQMVI